MNRTHWTMRFAFLQAAVIFLVYAAVFAKFEDDKPIGWASQSGGTTGGQGGPVHHCKSVGEASKYLSGSGKAVVYLSGSGGSIAMGSNKTLIGVGGPRLGGIRIGGQSNVIIRNITIRQGKCSSYRACASGSDGIAISGSKHIWIDHCDIADGQDESISVTKNCDYLTFTWNKFHYTYDKAHAYFNLIASSDGDQGGYNITFAYNWWGDNILERQPRSRYGKIHVVNNLYTSLVSRYCVGVGKNTTSRVENNVFIKANMPVMIAASSSGGVILGNLYDEEGMDPNRKGAGFTPFQDFVRGNNADTTWGNGGFEPPYEMDIMPAGQVEAIVKKWAGTVLEDFPENFKVPTKPMATIGRPQLIFKNKMENFSLERFQGNTIDILTLQGKSLYKGKANGLTARGTFFLPSGNIFILKSGDESGFTTIYRGENAGVGGEEP